MKLDNIIYDVGSLKSALTEQWNADAPSFQALFPSDTGQALLNVFAAYGAMLQYTIVSSLANVYCPTAFSEAAIYQLAETLGNSLHGNVSSQVQVKITKNNFIGISTTIPAETQFIIQNKNFFNPSAIMLPANVSTMSEIVLVQGEMIEVNKYTSGIPNEKIYFSSNWKCNHNYIKVYVNGEEWNVDDSFLEYDKNYVLDSSVMKTVVLRTDSDGRSYIKFGDNQLASLPTSGSSVRIKYVSNEGTDGNIQEKNISGALASELVFSDNYGNQDVLNIDIETITTAYGGFGRQSIDVLSQTSPYIFASGHRAVRRQDYNALLQNKCGYITSSVWGEYEEADKIGAYDALMMNMVYYTGIKSFQEYPYFAINEIMDENVLDSGLYSERGFYGSFSFRIQNLKDTTANVLIQDTGAKGYLFINDNSKDPRDSILEDWKNTMMKMYYARLASIVNPGKNYQIGDILILTGTNNDLYGSGINVDLNGSVTEAKLVKYRARMEYPTGNEYATTYSSGSRNGTGLTVKIAMTEMDGSPVVYTNDITDSNITEAFPDPIQNARSDMSYLKYYQSLKEPTLLQPVQIIFDFSTFSNRNISIAGVKFRAENPSEGPYPSTMCIFGTNVTPMPSLSNIRNSKDWVKLSEREDLVSPYNNTNDNWSDWYPTNCFRGTMDSEGNPEFDSYRYYVIEFYSTEDNLKGLKFVTLNKMKVMYSEDASVLYYADNSKFRIIFPQEGDIGPSNERYPDTETAGDKAGMAVDTKISEKLINTAKLPMYYYTTQLSGITKENGYRDGNILAYVFENENTKIPFYIDLVNVDNGVFNVRIGDNNTALTGTEMIRTTSPVSLDSTIVYKIDHYETGSSTTGRIDTTIGEVQGTKYKQNDVVEVVLKQDGETEYTGIRFRVTGISSDNLGNVTSVVILSDYNKTLGLALGGDTVYETELVSSPNGGGLLLGTGLKLRLKNTPMSGYSLNGEWRLGNGASIIITPNYNLQMSASFVGNRIDTQNINRADQPIIEKFNHFTTFLEYKQPEIIQVGITIKAELNTTAAITSGIIIQNIKNNVAKLFEVTSDYIGKGLKLSDIYTAVMSTPNVNWCKVIVPNDNVDIPMNGLLISSYIDVIETVAEY